MGLENCKTTREREVYIQSYPIGSGIAWAGFWIGIGIMMFGFSSCAAQIPHQDVEKIVRESPLKIKE